MATATQTASPRLVPLFGVKGNIISISQVQFVPHSAPVILDVLRDKEAPQAMLEKQDPGLSILEESEEISTDSGSEYESDPEAQQSEDQALEEKLEEEDLILNPSLHSLGLDAMLMSVLSSTKSIKKAGSRETELWFITRTDARHLGKMTSLAKAQHRVL